MKDSNTSVYYEKKNLPTAPLFLIGPYTDNKKVISTILPLACDATELCYMQVIYKNRWGKNHQRQQSLKLQSLATLNRVKCNNNAQNKFYFFEGGGDDS